MTHHCLRFSLLIFRLNTYPLCFSKYLSTQAVAAFAYSRNFDGVWFANSRPWVAQHLFPAASISEIPLVKPRFSCAVPPDFDVENIDLAHELSRLLDAHFRRGTCGSALLATEARPLRSHRPIFLLFESKL